LIEVMVSIALLGMAVAGVVTMIRNSRDMELDNEYRRQARLILYEGLEDTAYLPREYPAFLPQLGKAKTLNAGLPSQVGAVMDFTVSPEQWEMRSGRRLHFIVVSGRIRWEYAGSVQTVALAKRIYRTR
jgi:Tfp pilus assembly protein PilV